VTPMTRREWFATSASAALLLASRATAAPAPGRPPVVVFSKHLQFLDYAELAREVKAIGLDGVDLSVRKGGHVLPENVATDLPKATETIRAAGLDVAMIT